MTFCETKMASVRVKLWAKALDRLSVIVLRLGAIVLVVSSIVVAMRGYLRMGEHKESGPAMYVFIAMALFWAVVLWLYSSRRPAPRNRTSRRM